MIPSDLTPADPVAKAWWQSRTIIGIVVMLLSQILKICKVDIVPQELADIVSLVMDAAGAGLAIYGRINARQALKMTVLGGPWNTKADVRRATAAPRRDRGRASLVALWAVIIAFALIGLVIGSGGRDRTDPADRSDRTNLIARAEAMQAGGKPLAEWIQVVPVVDNRPFWQRVFASVRPSVAVAYSSANGAVSVQLTKIELRGGAEF